MTSLANGETFAIWKCMHATETAETAIDEAKALIDGSGQGVAWL